MRCVPWREELLGARFFVLLCAYRKGCDQGRCCLSPSSEEAKRCREKTGYHGDGSGQHLPDSASFQPFTFCCCLVLVSSYGARDRTQGLTDAKHALS